MLPMTVAGRALAPALALSLLAASCGGPAAPSSRGGLSFLLEASYPQRTTIAVGLRNDDVVAYGYNSAFPACSLEFADSVGRRFLIPPGTHCDLDLQKSLGSGETVILFRWALDECVEDRFGCAVSSPLPPGRYTIRGRYRAVADVQRESVAEGAFQIVP